MAQIDSPVLGTSGTTVQSIPVETVREFEAALDRDCILAGIYIYEGAGLAFSNPSGSNYAQDDAPDAWDTTLNLLKAHV